MQKTYHSLSLRCQRTVLFCHVMIHIERVYVLYLGWTHDSWLLNLPKSTYWLTVDHITVSQWMWQLHLDIDIKMESVDFWKHLHVLIIHSGEGWCVPDRAESSVITVKNNSAGVKKRHTSKWILDGYIAAGERTLWPERETEPDTANISHNTHLRLLADTHPMWNEDVNGSDYRKLQSIKPV